MPNTVQVITMIVMSILVMHTAGHLLLRLWGVSRRNSHFLAPVTSIIMLALAGISQRWVHLPWSLWYLLLWWLLLATVGVILKRSLSQPYRSRWLRTHTSRLRKPPADTHNLFGYSIGYAWFGAAIIGASLAFLTMNNALGGNWSLVSQTWDAMPHLNTIRHIVETSNASPWQLRNSTLLGVNLDSFYPGVFYQIAATIILITHAPVVVSANLAALLLAAWVFPLGCAFVMQQAAPRIPLLTLSTLLLAQAMWSFPWAPLGWGVLWPTTSSIALIPSAVGLFLAVFKSAAHRDPLQRLGYLFIAIAATGTVFAAHPRGGLQLVACLWVLIVGNLFSNAVAARRAKSNRSFAWAAGGIATVVVSVLALPKAYTGIIGSVDNRMNVMYWPINASTWQEIGNYLIQGPNNTKPSIFLAVLIFCGITYVLLHRKHGWLVLGFVLFATLDIIAATTHDPNFIQFTRLWYNDRYRITGAVAVFGVPLAAFGVHFLVNCGVTLLKRHSALGSRHIKQPLNFNAAVTLARAKTGLTAALLVVVYFATQGLNTAGHSDYLATYYKAAATAPAGSFVSPKEQAFLTTLTQWVKPDEVVVNLPGDGSGTLYALTGLQPLFPSTNSFTGGADASIIARSLTLPNNTGPTCPSLQRLNARWVLNSDDLFQTQAVRAFPTPILMVGPDDPRFKLVAQGGGMRLYHIEFCGFASSTATN